MATINHGILGGFSGSVGNIVGYRYKNRFFIRQRPSKSLKPPTLKQLAQRTRFRLTLAFVSPLRQALKPLPERGKRQVSAFNSCFSKVIRGAIAGSYPNLGIHYAAVKLTSGDLYSGCNCFVSEAGATLIFNWCPGTHNCRFEGSVVMLAYNPAKEQWIYHTADAGDADRLAMLELPCSFRGDRVETWLYFVSADRKAVSDSVYLGAVHVSGTFLCGQEVNLN